MMLGADVNDVTAGHVTVQDGATPMFVAAQNGHKDCIEVLARLGGDVNKAKTVSVEGAAQLVAGTLGGVRSMSNWVSWCWVLLGCNRERAYLCQNGSTPICIAALGGHKECIEVLAGLGGDIHAGTVRMGGVVCLMCA